MKNQYEIRGDVTAIFLKRKNGEILETLIETSDLEKVKSFPNTWFASWSDCTNSFYCLGSIVLPNYSRLTVGLHRWIMGYKVEKQIDHINNKTLDNQRNNLRIVTSIENNQNRAGAYKNSKSGIRGVYWDSSRGTWRAVVTINYKHINIGRFSSIKKAEMAIKNARAKYMPFSKEAKEVLTL